MVERCPRCQSEERVKNGHINGRQRYRCKECKYDYTVEQKSTAVSAEKKRLAIEMYLEGLGFNSIGRILKVSHVAVQTWVRKYGRKLEELKSGQNIEVVELDEMHSYIGQKKTIFGYGLLLIDMGKDSSISFWVNATEPPVERYGKK
jgi:transposase-like protein